MQNYVFKKIEDNRDAYSVIEECKKQLNELGFFQWNHYYKDFETFSKHMEEEKREVFGIYENDNLLGCVSLSRIPPKYYIEFESGEASPYMQYFTAVNESNVFYIGSLAVRPVFQGKGIAKAILANIEQLAKDRHIEAIRLDTRAENPIGVKLYESANYKKVYLDKVDHSESYNVYEKVL